MAISAETLIFLRDTETKVRVKDIKLGAQIGAFDTDSGNYSWCEVTKFNEQKKELFKVTVKAEGDERTIFVSADQNVVAFVSDEGDFRIMPLNELQYGMYILVDAEDMLELCEDSITVEPLGIQECYEVEVDGGEPFMTFPGQNSSMFLVA